MSVPRIPALLLSAAMAGPAQAGRPLQTEDAGVIEPGGCELEGVHAQSRLARQSSLQLACGIGRGSELAVQALRPRELALAGKTQLARWRDTQVTVAWALSHRHVETAWRRSGAGVQLVASTPAGDDWLLHANLGHQRDELTRRRSTPWALAAEHNGLGEGGRWQPMAEVFGDDRGQRWAAAALRVAVVPDRVFLDGSLGRQLGGAGARLATAGFKLAF